jgi:hypothetical protein
MNESVVWREKPEAALKHFYWLLNRGRILMKLFQMKTTVALSALLLGVAVAGPVLAANTATMTASVRSIGALDANNVTDMNFGALAITAQPSAGNTITLVKSSLTGVVTKTDNGTAASNHNLSSLARARQTIQITGGGSGENGTIVNMQHGAIGAFTNAAVLALDNITYSTASQPETTMTPSTNYPVTIVTGSAAESVYFGGRVTVSDTFTAGTADTATFVVTYAY